MTLVLILSFLAGAFVWATVIKVGFWLLGER